MFKAATKTWQRLLLLLLGVHAMAAGESLSASEAISHQAPSGAGQLATIHWQGVPLRDVVGRLEELFEDAVFVDRRVNPNQRVSLDIEASCVEDVLQPIAAKCEMGLGRLGRVVFLGPRTAAEHLHALADWKAEEIEHLAADQRAVLERRESLAWPRLAEPKNLVAAAVEQRGWRVAESQRIPHDLWSAGELLDLTLAEQLSLLLIGFELTFEVQPAERVVKIVPLDVAALERLAERSQPPAYDDGARQGRPATARPLRNTKQVYTLRVVEQPARAVLNELAQRLNWQVEIDEAAIRAAGRSLENRVSFAVENVGQDELLEALLRPVDLSFRREGEQIRIVPADLD